MFGSASGLAWHVCVAGCARSAVKINFMLTRCIVYRRIKSARNGALLRAYSAGAGRVSTIYISNADLDRSSVTVLGRGNECCKRLRRRTLFYLLVSATLAFPSVDAFSNP